MHLFTFCFLFLFAFKYMLNCCLSLLWEQFDIPLKNTVFCSHHPDDFIAQVQGSTDRSWKVQYPACLWEPHAVISPHTGVRRAWLAGKYFAPRIASRLSVGVCPFGTHNILISPKGYDYILIKQVVRGNWSSYLRWFHLTAYFVTITWFSL